MIPQRAIAVPGLRTDAQPGWRSLIGHALAAPAAQPRLWLLGVLSFSLRGGIVLLGLPIIVLPTQVEVRLALGTNLGSAGLTSGFWMMVGTATVGSALVALGVLYALARIESAAFARLMGDGEMLDHASLGAAAKAAAPAAARGARRGLLTQLFVIEALTLVAVLLAAVPLAASVGQATLDEILRPSSGASIYARVLGHAAPALAVFLAALPVIDVVSAGAARRLLLGTSLKAVPGGALTAFVRAPLRILGTAVVSWVALLMVLAGVAWALSIAWQSARASFLAATSLADLFSDPAPFVVAALLAAVFVAGLALAGFASAFRAALWTLAALRR